MDRKYIGKSLPFFLQIRQFTGSPCATAIQALFFNQPCATAELACILRFKKAVA
ncbi:MAG: hypothetical protein LUQ11_16025 [Methylococcaceae bacterium]|nr:hypothetical protein [Methylococcaceae bacterium]